VGEEGGAVVCISLSVGECLGVGFKGLCAYNYIRLVHMCACSIMVKFKV
jgi:hypothetical protein